MTGRKQLFAGLVILGMLVAGDLLSVLLRYYLSGAVAKGIAFFAVTFVAYVIFKKHARFGLLPSLVICVLAGLVAVVGELLWPGR